ncbi:MAG: hypothetical protein ABSG53_23895, partial [Thermoguttaceae bacterium]
MNVDCQPHNQSENHDAPRSEHDQRRPQHHEQQEQRPQAKLKRRAGRRYFRLGLGRGHGVLLDDADSTVWRSSPSIHPRRRAWQSSCQTCISRLFQGICN